MLLEGAACEVELLKGAVRGANLPGLGHLAGTAQYAAQEQQVKHVVGQYSPTKAVASLV